MTAPIHDIISRYIQLLMDEYDILSSYPFDSTAIRSISIAVNFKDGDEQEEGTLDLDPVRSGNDLAELSEAACQAQPQQAGQTRPGGRRKRDARWAASQGQFLEGDDLL